MAAKSIQYAQGIVDGAIHVAQCGAVVSEDEFADYGWPISMAAIHSWTILRAV